MLAGLRPSWGNFLWLGALSNRKLPVTPGNLCWNTSTALLKKHCYPPFWVSRQKRASLSLCPCPSTIKSDTMILELSAFVVKLEIVRHSNTLFGQWMRKMLIHHGKLRHTSSLHQQRLGMRSWAWSLFHLIFRDELVSRYDRRQHPLCRDHQKRLSSDDRSCWSQGNEAKHEHFLNLLLHCIHHRSICRTSRSWDLVHPFCTYLNKRIVLPTVKTLLCEVCIATTFPTLRWQLGRGEF